MIEPDNWWKEKLVTFIATHTPKCHDITRLISESMERPLPWRKRLAVRVHYSICVWCRRYQSQLRFLRKALHDCGESGNLTGGMPDEVRDRLKASLDRAK